MCFGDKNEKNDDPGPRPAQFPPQQPTYAPQDTKMSSKKDQQAYTSPQNGQSSYSPPSAAPPSQSYAPPPGPPPRGDYAPPSGPPPTMSYAAPPGPPPFQQQTNEYAPPPGPPPANLDYTAPPPGPPPANLDYTAPPPGAPPSKHDWEVAVPDTSLFPPPPAFFSGWDRSPANNSTEREAEAGEAWTKQYPLIQPITLDPAAQEALRTHNIRLMQPSGFQGTLNWRGPGVWECVTQKTAPDSCIIGYPPIYAVTAHSPLGTGRIFKAYYEVHIRADSRQEETSLALGYTALPYPNFRLPGWHRGSVAVHGDDGHRYVNDRWGGKSFTGPFARGETLGIGMTFEAVNGRMNVDIFLTRDGKLVGSWNLHEEGDAEQDLPVTGLEGFHDLSCAIGTFNRVSFEVVFDPSRWKYKDV